MDLPARGHRPALDRDASRWLKSHRVLEAGATRQCAPQVANVPRGFGRDPVDRRVAKVTPCYQRFELHVGPAIQAVAPHCLPDVAADDAASCA